MSYTYVVMIKIFNTAKKFGAKCIMTSTHHNNGTERIFEAYKKISKKEI